MGIRTTVERGDRGTVRVTRSRTIGPPRPPKPGELREAEYRRIRRRTSAMGRLMSLWAAFKSFFRRRPMTAAERQAQAKLAAENFKKAHPHCVAHVFKTVGGKRVMTCWPPGSYGIPRNRNGHYIRTDDLPEHAR